MKLTPREEKFCNEYVKRLNKTQSAIAAGYSKKSAKEIGYETFTRPHIKNRIEEIQLEIREKLGIDEHTVLSELANLSFWNIKDFLTEGNTIKDLTKIPKAKLKPVIGIKVKTTRYTIDKVEYVDCTAELKMADKRGAIVDLGRHLGIFEADNKQKMPITPEMSDSQFEKLLSSARETKTPPSQ